GSALVPGKRADSKTALRVVPSKFIDGLTRGGGNPSVPITSDQQKGDPNATPAPTPPPPQPKRAETPQPQPKVTQPPQPSASRIPKDPLNLKPVTRTTPTSEMADVKPTTRSTKDRQKPES